MSDFYHLTESKEVVPCSAEQYMLDREAGIRRVGKDIINGHYVSTVFLGTDHDFFGQGVPLVFETMVFEDDKIGCQIYMDRYSTWDEALAGHNKAIAWVLGGCLDE
jgi:hypothetical protein